MPRLHAHLIVRDEEEALTGCLAALAGVVDRVHVHDTGSTDATVGIALAAGATVSHGLWTGDFAAARNEATERAAEALDGGFGESDWVLSVDADERLRADPDALRRLLAAPATDGRSPDGVLVEIDNEHDETPYVHAPARLYRPAVASFRGPVHEQLARRDGSALRTVRAPRATISLLHSGYRDETRRRNKARRNAAIAQARLDAFEGGDAGGSASEARLTLDLARSRLGAGEIGAAGETFRTVWTRWPASAAAVESLEFLTRIALGLGQDAEALRWIAALRESSPAQDYADWLEAQALAQLGSVDRAAVLLAGISQLVDSGGRRYPTELLLQMRGLVEELQAVLAAQH